MSFNEEYDEDRTKAIVEAAVDGRQIRSALTCQSCRGVCRSCLWARFGPWTLVEKASPSVSLRRSRSVSREHS